VVFGLQVSQFPKAGCLQCDAAGVWGVGAGGRKLVIRGGDET
jgi:hypothetical protein